MKKVSQQKIDLILNHFKKFPTTYSNSFQRLQNQFQATREEVEQAKTLFFNDKIKKVAQKTEELKRETKFDYETGQHKVSVESLQEIRTPEKLFEVLGLDVNEWVCTQFWSIIKNDRWHISAFIKARTHSFKNYEDFFQDYQPKYYSETQIQSEENNVLVVYLSDRHIGAMTKRNAVLDNYYDADIYRERMEKVFREVVSLNRRYNFSDIVVVDLGDTVDGMDGYTTRRDHRIPQNMDNREVFETFMDVELEFSNSLIAEFPLVNLHRYTVGDSNHGGDFEWFCHKSLEYALSDSKFLISTGSKFIEHFYINDHCFIICHGKDSEDMKRNLPKNLDDKTEIYIKSYMDQMGIKPETNFVHFIKGDLHQAASDYGRFFRYKNCPSMYGSSKWASTNFMNNTCATAFDIITPTGVTEHLLFF